LVTDHLSVLLALAVATSHDFPPLGSAAPSDLNGTLVPDPALDGLLRPPRSRD
jgi:hypothetical protein